MERGKWLTKRSAKVLSRQEHDKKMAEIQEKIENAHKKLQEHAD